MPKRMLIDASHPEETRVVVLDGNKVEEFDFEAASRLPLKGNIYLAKVTRVEPSLQAAFVEYGGNRQGFLAFSEIHPDYYQIPVADRMAILAAQTQRMMAEEDEVESLDLGHAPAQEPMPGVDEDQSEQSNESSGESGLEAQEHGEPSDAEDDDEQPQENGDASTEHEADASGESNPVETGAEGEPTGVTTVQAEAESLSGEAPSENPRAEVRAEATGAPVPHRRREHRPRPPRRRQYKIQEVIKRRQIMLVQVVKEERGNKGASLTTFLSLAGRYCVLMPNTPRGGGISRKITSATDRKRLKSAAQSLELPEGMGLIIRTAGANRTKVEIKRDYEYLLRLWDTVRELTLKSNAPALVYEEGSLIKRAIRDLYSKDISEIVVDGEASYRDAKEFMRMLMPSHAKNVKPYKEPLPLFQRFHVEAQLDAMFSPVVNLRSGGYIVINQTEALVSIDVNSGKATREHSIEETATKTNLEASDEIARQLRLRDLAGLIVVDFIDMEDMKNDRIVEKRLHNAVRNDRARIQIGKISQFGLLEMSRQRLRAGVLAGSTVTCPHCAGQGIIRSTESAALRLLRALDEEGQKQPAVTLSVKAPPDVTIYTLNHKRREILRIEEAYDLGISFDPQDSMMGGSFELERTGVRPPSTRPKPVSVDAGFASAEPTYSEEDVTIAEAPADAEEQPDSISADVESPAGQSTQAGKPNGQGDGKRRRRRRRRGGRGRGGNPGEVSNGEQRPSEPRDTHLAAAEAHDVSAETSDAADDDAGQGDEPGEARQSATAQPQPQGEGGRRRRRRRGRRGRRPEGESPVADAGEGSTYRASTEIPHQDDQPLIALSHETNGAAERVSPNAPSSPQFSLADPALDQQSFVPDRVLPPIEPQHEQRPSSAVETMRTAMLGTPPPSETMDAPAAEPTKPSESRKGWWQRRFKS